MKLVITYDTSDGFTYSLPTHIPFEYESKEKAEYDLICMWEQWQKNQQMSTSNVMLGTVDIDLWYFTSASKIYIEPKIRLLEEWFEQEKY